MIATGLYVSQKKLEPHCVEVLGKINVRSFERGDDVRARAHEVRGRLTLTLATMREGRLYALTYLWQAEVTLWLPWGGSEDLRIEKITELNSLNLNEQDVRDLIYTSEICDVLMEEIEKGLDRAGP